MAACSEDMIIKVTPRDSPEQTFDLTEHTGPVLRIDLSVNGLLASSSGDGTMKIWDLAEKKCIKTLSGFSKIKSYQETEVYGELSTSLYSFNSLNFLNSRVTNNNFYSIETTVTPSFEPKSGKMMAYNQDKTIIILDTQNWTVKKTLVDETVLATNPSVRSNIVNAIKLKVSACSTFLTGSFQIQYMRVFEVWQIYCSRR